MSLLLSIIGILLTIFIVIGTHEAAHFIAARLVGVKVLRFSIGFGKTLLRWRDRKNTEYVFALIPLGGYVKMLDENEGNVPATELSQAYNRQPFYKKFFIVIAGPLANLLCAFFLYWLIFVMGIVTVKPIIGEIIPSSIAATSGIKTNQEILSVDNHKTPTWQSVLFRVLTHAGNKDQIKIITQNLQDKKTQTYLLDLSHWQLDELKPDPLLSLGIKPYEPPMPLIISGIAKDSPAVASSLKKNDKIIALDNKPVKNWTEVMTYLIDRPEQTVIFTIERQHKVQKIPVKLGYKRSLLLKKYGYLGIGPSFQWPPEFLQTIKYSPFGAIAPAFQQMQELIYFNFLLIGKLITGKVSLQSLGGPITIFESAGAAFNYGFFAFISFLAFLSLSIGIINILPIPGLDGGHLVIQTIELITRKPLSERVLSLLYRLGFILILFLLIQSLTNDILRLY